MSEGWTEADSLARRPGIYGRPIALPSDIDDPGIEKASGVVELPRSVYWNTPRTCDLDDRRQRARVYEIVMREGAEQDVRHFIDLDTLIDLWEDLVLARRLRRAWIAFVHERRGVTLPSGPHDVGY